MHDLIDLVRRPRRLRSSAALRELVAETRLDAAMLMQPHFIVAGSGVDEPINAMPGIAHQSVDRLVETVASDYDLGIRSVLLFGVPDDGKSPDGSSAALADGLVPRAVAALKERYGADLVVATDVCLCAYTDHGHCGMLDTSGRILNDPSLRPLANMAVAHARAGADIVAPSDMMDGRVGAIRTLLDDEGFDDTAIMSYAVKYASAYYGPFREAAHSAPTAGDRKSYQMDVRNIREALVEAALDVEEGADFLMVKPALAYLDVIRAVKEAFDLPLACYNVSGEYSMVKAAAAAGLVDEAAIVRENLLAMHRAGADVLISYHGRDALKGDWL